MTSDEFGPLVRRFGLPIPWLADHIGGVSERTFRHWANGRAGAPVGVPPDASERMQRLNLALEKLLK